MSKPTIVVAGASGFIGKALCKDLAQENNVIGLSRINRKTTDNIQWKACDLFSLKQTEQAVAGADLAVFLVHSMMPQARLIQGRFDDFDVIIADNFARACQTAGVKKIVYLGGIIPEGKLSRHLESRKEVESVLASHGVPVVVIRAGLVVGAGGSSFQMMVNLVKRLPVMVCPAWTFTRGQPVSLEDTVAVLKRSVLDQKLESSVWDIGGPDQLAYSEMMSILAELYGLKRIFFHTSIVSVQISRLWLTVVTGYPKELVSPLIQSLRSPMLVGDRDLFKHYGITPKSFRQCIKEIVEGTRAISDSTKNSAPKQVADNIVCSMQRLVLPHEKDVKWVADEYGRWLVRFMFPLIVVETDHHGHFDFVIRWFVFFGPKIHFLHLHYDTTRSSESRRLYYIKGGLLLSRNAHESGRLEFRRLPNGRDVMAAIFNFRPSLHWWIYKFTQAQVHLWVMRNFGRHLRRIDRNSRRFHKVGS